MKIRVLPDNLANQIAAGEVVERPASVVKELVENSIDAGATRVEIDIELGGRRLMRVSDDGSGMVREDAILAFERHATSKISTLEDLAAIGTLGFRGEALASIASVAKVELTTRMADSDAATRVLVEGGRLVDVKDAGRAPGTTIAVRDHGPGIASADLDHVFDRFFRAVAARSQPGSGLGLSIVTEIAAAHGGSTFAENHPDGGAVVGFTVPVATGPTSAD